MIEVKNLKKSYQIGENETPVLKGISFLINDGEYVAIMGPSGSGKSTLMHILGALDSPSGGTFLFNGEDVSKFSENELADVRRNKIGFVFQSFNLLPRATVMKNVTLPLIYADVPAGQRLIKAENALKAVDLPEDRWHHLSNQLSGGQMQRVAIARALVNDPKLILADEPTGNLDTETGEVVLDTFQDLNCNKNHTIVLITHEKEVAQHADRIIFIRDGLIVSDEKNKNKIARCKK